MPSAMIHHQTMAVCSDHGGSTTVLNLHLSDHNTSAPEAALVIGYGLIERWVTLSVMKYDPLLSLINSL